MKKKLKISFVAREGLSIAGRLTINLTSSKGKREVAVFEPVKPVAPRVVRTVAGRIAQQRSSTMSPCAWVKTTFSV